MKFTLRFLLMVILVAAAFTGGWVAKTNYDKLASSKAAKIKPIVGHLSPQVDGVVLRTKKDLVAISGGADDGLKVGSTVDFFRGGQYLNRGKILRVRNNMSSVRIIDEDNTAPVVEGDRFRFVAVPPGPKFKQ